MRHKPTAHGFSICVLEETTAAMNRIKETKKFLSSEIELELGRKDYFCFS